MRKNRENQGKELKALILPEEPRISLWECGNCKHTFEYEFGMDISYDDGQGDTIEIWECEICNFKKGFCWDFESLNIPKKDK